MKSRKLSRMGRRRFLNTLTTLGVSGAAVAHMSQDALAELTDDPTKEVPRLSTIEHVNHQEIVEEDAPPKREPNYYTISRDEWAVVETAHDAKDKVNRLLSAIPGTEHVKAGVTTVTNGHTSEKAVVVKRTVGKKPNGEMEYPAISEQELRDKLPASVSGTAGEGETAETIEDIPVTVETERMVGHVQGVYDNKYRPVPGGAQLDHTLDPDKWLATTGVPAHNNDANKWDILTAGHALETDKEPGQAEYDELVGLRRDEKYDSQEDANFAPGFDAGVMDLYHDKKSRLAAKDGGYRDRHVVGIVGRDEIKDKEGKTNYELDKQGNRTGVESGSIIEVYDISYDTDAAAERGDSGGPHYKKAWDSNYMYWKVYVAGSHYAGHKYEDKSRATMMEEIENRYNPSI